MEKKSRLGTADVNYDTTSWYSECFVGYGVLSVLSGSFSACWRQANVTPMRKGPPSSSVANYRPISLTSVLSIYKMFAPGVGSS